MRSIKVMQECEGCGKRFPIIYYENGSYDYCDGDESPCECEEPFHLADGEPSLSEWVEKVRAIRDSYQYKIQQLREMLDWEEAQPEDKRYGAHLSHWSGHGKPINLDAGAISALIEYYSSYQTEKFAKRWIKDESGVIVCPVCGEEHAWYSFRASFCDNCGERLLPEEGYEEET